MMKQETISENGQKERLQFGPRVFVIGQSLIYPYRSTTEHILEPDEMSAIVNNPKDSLIGYLPQSRRDPTMPNEGIVFGSFFNTDPNGSNGSTKTSKLMSSLFQTMIPDSPFNSKFNTKKDIRSPEEALVIALAARALINAGIDKNLFDDSTPWLPKNETGGKPLRIALGIGNSLGPVGILGEAARNGLTNPVMFGLARAGLSGHAQTAGMEYLNGHGPSILSQAACSTGLGNIHEGYYRLKTNQAELAIVGGSEIASELIWAYTLSKLAMPDFEKYKDNPENASRPGDINQSGLTLLEGGSAFVLATEETIQRLHIPREKILAEILGSAVGHDSVRLVPPITSQELIRVKTEALENAGLKSNQIDAITNHATGTKSGDIHDWDTERLLHEMPARKYEDEPDIIVYQGKPHYTAPKSYTGHNLAGSGSLSTIHMIDIFKRQIIPPTRNIETTHGKVFNLVYGQGLKKEVNYGMVSAVGMDGTVATVIYARVT